MYCGLPLGGAAAAAIMTLPTHPDWRIIFYFGGLGPLLLAPVIAGTLTSPPSFDGEGKAAVMSSQGEMGLFRSHATKTLLLWTSYFFTLLVVYLLLNWLPSLLVAKGYTKPEAAAASLCMNLGAVMGSLVLGRLADRQRIGAILVFTYLGMVSSLLALAIGLRVVLLPAAIATGFFVIGGQLVLYALGPMIYPAPIRGTGVGAAVAVGRAGSIAGPLLAGALLAQGFKPGVVPIMAIPGLMVALAAVLVLVAKYLKESDRLARREAV